VGYDVTIIFIVVVVVVVVVVIGIAHICSGVVVDVAKSNATASVLTSCILIDRAGGAPSPTPTPPPPPPLERGPPDGVLGTMLLMLLCVMLLLITYGTCEVMVVLLLRTGDNFE
jgi:hypothetical protein